MTGENEKKVLAEFLRVAVLEVAKKRVDMALQDMVSQAWWCWVGGWTS